MDVKTRERYEREVAFGEMFQKTHLYKLMKEFSNRGGKIDDPIFDEILTEIKAHPEYGFSVKLRKDMKRECLVMTNHFSLDTDKMCGNSWFLYYDFDNFDFDNDLNNIKRSLAA